MAEAKVLWVGRRFGVTHGSDAFVENTEVDCALKLMVKPEQGEPFEVKTRIRFPQLSLPQEGSKLQVIYNPDDPKEMILQDGVDQLSAILGPGNPFSSAMKMAMEGASEEEMIASVQQSLNIQAGSQTDELERLSEMHRRGDLTDEEFAKAKARLLGQ